MSDFHDNWRKFINESSLSRLHQHTQEHDTAIITAYRDDPADPEGCIEELPSHANDNISRNRELKAVLLRKGYGVTRVDGSYVENFEDPDPLKRVEVSEESFFVVNLKDDPGFVDEIKNLGETFCQDSVLIIPQGGADAYLLGTNDTLFPGYGGQESVGDYSAGREAEFMSKIRGRPFTFKEIKNMETFENLSRNAKWVVAKITERVLKK
jgi:hypothetical protein